MQFEWDEIKNQTNKQKHGISFEAAALVFHDPFLITVPDNRYEYCEERWLSVGLVNDFVLYVAHIMWDEEYGEEIIRIISARAATPREERKYFTHRRVS